MSHLHGVFDSDTHFSINPVTRQIKNESSRKTTLIQFDHNSERFTFEIPRYIEGHDMSICDKVEVHYLNVDAKTKEESRGVYTSNDLQISADDENVVVCSWLISGGATRLIGKLSFVVRFCCVEGIKVTYAWNTAVASVDVSTGIDASDAVVADYSDVLEKWKVELFDAGYINAATMQQNISDLSAALAVERKRIDNIAKLPNGSTAGDAELADARVDFNGYVYSNLGNAMRFQTQEIVEEVDSLTEIGSNLINPEEMVNGTFVSQDAGTIHTASTHKLSPFIKIKPNTEYCLDCYYGESLRENDGSKRYALYDAECNYISGGVGKDAFATPGNAKYIRVSANVDAKIMLYEQGESQGRYVPYTKNIKGELISSECDSHFSKRIAEMVDSSVNLFNPYTVIHGCYVNQTNGVVGTGNHILSDYLEIKGGQHYVVGFFNGAYEDDLHELRYAFYDKDKTFITGAGLKNSFDAPSFAKYIRISFYNTAPAVMFCEGSELPEYVDFQYSFKPYLVDGYTKDEIKALLGVYQSIPFNLPSVVYGLVGEELNIYFDNLVDGHDSDYLFNVTCPVGQQMERCYRVTPTEAGEYALKIDVIRKRDNATISKSAALKIADKTAAADSVRVLVIGDSTTANGICVSKLVENFVGDAMTLKMLGTRGTAPARHEGRSGWTFNQFVNVGTDANVSSLTNAFYNPNTGIFDMAYYLENNRIEKPDVVIINLGINDCFSHLTDDVLSAAIAEIDANCEIMMNSIRAACSDAKICIALTIPPNYSQDAFGKGYNCGQTQWRYKRNNVLWVEHLIDMYDKRESENIFVIPIHTNLDTRYNMGMEEIQHNKRNESTYFSPIANGGVHPVDSGYWQIADVYWFFLKNTIS